MNQPCGEEHRQTGESEMTDLIERIREVIENHRIEDASDNGCRCGAEGSSDHSGHVAQEIIDHLRLRRETVGDEIRYVGAWFNYELTILEGAQ
jgi:hypothetical protein